MIKCVHIDSDGSLEENMDITLLKLPPFEISKAVLEWAHSQFPDGLSFWGWKCIPSIYAIEQDTFDIHDPNFASCLIEHDFEMVRRRNFPEMPSRLQCVFAAATIGDLFSDWAVLFHANASCYEAFCDTSYSMDAAFLKAYSYASGYKLSDSTPGIENIYKYWRKEKSPSPKTELLLPLQQGVHIGIDLTIRSSY